MDKKVSLFLERYNLLKDAVYNYALRMLNDRDVAADVVQNVFLKFFEKIDSIRDELKVNIWIFTVARNEIFGEFRKRKKDIDSIEKVAEKEKLHESGRSVIEDIELKEMRDLILQALDKLPPVSKEVFLLREYGGFSYGQIAELTGSTISSVKSRLFKTRRRLINEISEFFK